MTKRTTRVMLEVKWNDEVIDHPAGWDWPALCASNPFEPESDVKMKSFEDIDDDGILLQV